MKASTYSVYDEKAEMYLKPFVVPADGQALREFGDAIFNPDTYLGKHPKDYSLYKIAIFDDNKGSFESIVPPECMLKGSDVLNNEKEYKPQEAAENAENQGIMAARQAAS